MRLADKDDTRRSDETLRPVADLLVRRIARNLGVPVSTLVDATADDTGADHSFAAMAELRALFAAFRKLKHPAARRRCIAMAEAELMRQTRRVATQP